MGCRPGYCCVCDKSLVQDGRITGDYTQVEMKWSNGSVMPIAVCKDCAKDHKFDTAHAKAQITQSHQEYWDKTGGRYDKAVIIV